MNKPAFYSIHRLIKAFGYSIEGIRAALRTEAAFQIEVVLALILIPTALLLDRPPVARAALASSIFIVLMAELVNSAIESVVDRISQEKHPLSKRAKDIGSAIVLVSLANAACVWGVILWR
jgi:diacylglycerol kinase (ATP)